MRPRSAWALPVQSLRLRSVLLSPCPSGPDGEVRLSRPRRRRRSRGREMFERGRTGLGRRRCERSVSRVGRRRRRRTGHARATTRSIAVGGGPARPGFLWMVPTASSRSTRGTRSRKRRSPPPSDLRSAVRRSRSLRFHRPRAPYQVYYRRACPAHPPHSRRGGRPGRKPPRRRPGGRRAPTGAVRSARPRGRRRSGRESRRCHAGIERHPHNPRRPRQARRRIRAASATSESRRCWLRGGRWRVETTRRG